MSTIIKNDSLRIWHNKGRLLVMFALIAAAVAVALYMSHYQKETLRIAYVGTQDELAAPNQHVAVTYVTEKPATSQLLKGTYDAVVEKTSQSFQITTIKNAAFKKRLQQLLTATNSSTAAALTGSADQKRGAASLVIGYLLMFVLMTSMSNMVLFSEDKEKALLERIACSPLSLLKVLAGHSIFSLLLLFLPTLSILFFSSKISQISLGLSWGHYTLLIGLLCLFAAALAIFVATLFKDSERANMLGSTLIIATTMLSGSFFTFESNHQWLKNLIQLLPQKQYLTLVQRLENGADLADLWLPCGYLLLLTLLLFLLASWKTVKDYVQT